MKKAVVTKKAPKAVPFEKPLRFGDKGPAVQYLCHLLQKNGSSIKATDTFAIGMRSAVVSFQKKNKLKITGIVDKKTWDKLSAKK